MEEDDAQQHPRMATGCASSSCASANVTTCNRRASAAVTCDRRPCGRATPPPSPENDPESDRMETEGAAAPPSPPATVDMKVENETEEEETPPATPPAAPPHRPTAPTPPSPPAAAAPQPEAPPLGQDNEMIFNMMRPLDRPKVCSIPPPPVMTKHSRPPHTSNIPTACSQVPAHHKYKKAYFMAVRRAWSVSDPVALAHVKAALKDDGMGEEEIEQASHAAGV